jgi:hypothetical protein
MCEEVADASVTYGETVVDKHKLTSRS